MKKINLTTDSSQFFRPEQFDIEVFNGKEVPVMILYEDDMLSESLLHSLYSHDFAALPSKRSSDNNGNLRKYLCVTDSFYIISERGETGFDTSFHYFAGEIKTTGDEISINISSIDDKTITESIYNGYLENTFSCADMFNKHIINFSDRRNYNDCSVKHLKLLETTEFIRLPYNGNQRKIAAKVDNDGKLILERNNGYRHINTGKDVLYNIEIGAVLYRRTTDFSNMLEVVKLQRFAKDLYGNFYAVVEMVYTYPEDSKKIEATYPTSMQENVCQIIFSKSKIF